MGTASIPLSDDGKFMPCVMSVAGTDHDQFQDLLNRRLNVDGAERAPILPPDLSLLS
jgi:hypothetical protein